MYLGFFSFFPKSSFLKFFPKITMYLMGRFFIFVYA